MDFTSNSQDMNIESPSDSKSQKINISRRYVNEPEWMTKTGVIGIRAFYSNRELNNLHVVALWRTVEGEKRIIRTREYSSVDYGLVGAIKQALERRKKATGKKSASLVIALERIKRMIDKNLIVSK